MVDKHPGFSKVKTEKTREEKSPPSRPNNPHGNPGYHPSTDGYGHDGREHSSKDR